MSKPMKVLVLYTNKVDNPRKTIIDHLFCFQNYINHIDFHYCNVIQRMPYYLKFVNYDGIILHYTLFSMRWTPIWHDFFRGLKSLKRMKSIKVALPQDEYVYSDEICRLFQEYKVETVFTCAKPVDYETIYPKEKAGLKYYFTTYTGFVDENSLKTIETLSKEIKKRDIEIGYRARQLPYYLGHFGQLKDMLAKKFNTLKKASFLKKNISTNIQDVFYGDDWLRFLLRCRTMLGCLGGASLHDPKGKIREKVEAYIQQHPKASFEEVEQHCFKGRDNSLRLFVLSPRHFECAMTKTCQILVEGDYDGVFLPGIHYIELKRDFSNSDDVIEKIKDRQLCQKIAERTFRDIVLSGKYTYRKFAEDVIQHIQDVSPKSSQNTQGFLNTFLFHLVGYCLRKRKELEKFHLFVHRFYLAYKIRLPHLRSWLKTRLCKFFESIF